MEFLNARKGVGYVFCATIIQFLAAIAVALSTADFVLNQGSMPFKVTTLVISIAFLVFALIVNIVGLRKASKDESGFSQALTMIIISLVFSFANVVLPYLNLGLDMLYIIQPFESLFSILAVTFICGAISKLYEKKDNIKMAKKGTTTAVIYIITFALSKALQMFMNMNIGKNMWTEIFIFALAFLCVLLAVIGYIKYLLYLNKSRKEL